MSNPGTPADDLRQTIRQLIDEAMQDSTRVGLIGATWCAPEFWERSRERVVTKIVQIIEARTAHDLATLFASAEPQHEMGGDSEADDPAQA